MMMVWTQTKKTADDEREDATQRRRTPVTADDKLSVLVEEFRFTSAELALLTGSSLRAIESRRSRLDAPDAVRRRRRSAVDEGIDAAYSLATMLRDRYLIDPDLVRAWLLGRSAYLEEQRPAELLAAGHFELVRDAATAFARCEDPGSFADLHGPIPSAEERRALA